MRTLLSVIAAALAALFATGPIVLPPARPPAEAIAGDWHRVAGFLRSAGLR